MYRSDEIDNHMAWAHDSGAGCVTCLGRGFVLNLWGGDREPCPVCKAQRVV